MNIQTLANQGKTRVHRGLAEIEMSRLKGMRNEGLKNCFTHFDGWHCKLEFIAKIHDKKFVNDAASRSVNGTWYALENVEGNVIWIAKGNGSKVDYTPILPEVGKKVQMLLCMGTDSRALHETFDGVVPMVIDVADMKDAVHRALYNNLNKATVVYSPACEDTMSVEEDGEIFRREVNEL